MTVNLTGFLGVVLLAYLIPGPDFVVVLKAAARGPRLGRAAALGAQAGLCMHMLAAAFGLSAIAARSAIAFTAIKLAGAAYLVYLGVRAVIAARRAPAADRTGTGAAAPEDRAGTWGRSFTEGLTTNVLNPKAALFFLSVLPQFVAHDGHGGSVTAQIFLLGTLDVLVGVVYWLALVGVSGPLRGLLSRPAVRRRWDTTTGCLLVTVGVGVAAAD